MDGASKFVKGDAIISLLVTFLLHRLSCAAGAHAVGTPDNAGHHFDAARRDEGGTGAGGTADYRRGNQRGGLL